MRFVVFISCLCLFLGIAAAQTTQPSAPAAIREDTPLGAQPPAARTFSSEAVLRQRLDHFKVEGIPFRDVIRILQQSSGANFGVRWNQLAAAGIDPETPISIELRGVTLARLLRAILDSISTDATHLVYYVHENVITISPSHSTRTNLITRVYDITDLTFQIPDLDPADHGDSRSNSPSTSNQSSSSTRSRNSRH